MKILNNGSLKMEINQENVFLCCRMCLSMEKIDEMDTLTEFYSVCGKKIVEIVDLLFKIKINWCLRPYKLCQTCRIKLEEILNFQDRLVYTDSIFKALVENHKIEECHDIIKNEHNFQDENLTVPITYETTEEVLAGLKTVRHKKQIRNPTDKFHCFTCKTDYADECFLLTHLEDHSSLIPYECNLCENRTTIKTVTNLNKHLALHDEERPFKCRHCSLRFSLAKQLKKHENLHQNNMRTKSKIINMLQKRKKIHGPPITKNKLSEKTVDLTRCNICKTNFENKEQLQSHLSAHFGMVPYHCSLCNNQLIRSTSGLNKHMALHDEDRPFECSYCPKRFTTSERLRKHEFNHRDKMGVVVRKVVSIEKKKHQCSICGQTFAYGSNMRTHENIHTQSVKYECKVCGKNFNQAKNLRRHEQIHTGEMPYKCLVCGKGYIQSNDLKDHVTLHTGALPYRCSMCHKQFRTRTILKTHSKMHVLQDGEKKL